MLGLEKSTKHVCCVPADCCNGFGSDLVCKINSM